MRGGKCRSLNSIIYGIIILVRFIFEVTYHIISVPRDECATNFYSLPRAIYSLRTLSSDVIFFLNTWRAEIALAAPRVILQKIRGRGSFFGKRARARTRLNSALAAQFT